MQKLIEICANSVESALIAQQAGAHRVELCAGMPEGGTTPSYGEIALARNLLQQTKLHVIIRPRGGDFLYTPLEQEIMLRDIKMAKEIGVDGVVIGSLNPNGSINIPVMQKLMEEAKGLSVTFHRAFDRCYEPKKALEQIIELGVERILTSGQQPTAEHGIPLIKEMVEQASGRIIIMPGCGVNAANIKKIAQQTGAKEFHLSGRSVVESGMQFRNTNVSMGGAVTINEFQRELTDINKVKEAIAKL